MRGLVVFDVDGTLTDSFAVDEEAYLQALRDVDIADPDPDWSHYRHATDRGIFDQAFEAKFGRPPRDSEAASFEHRLIERLEAALRAAPGRSSPIAGAPAMIDRLEREGRWHATIATGAFERSLAGKLRAAGLALDLWPRATSSDAVSREAVVGLAIERASRGHEPFDRIVSVGDGVWDVRTARALGLPFVGIGRGARAEHLRREGAALVCADYLDLDAFLRALDQAEPPS